MLGFGKSRSARDRIELFDGKVTHSLVRGRAPDTTVELQQTAQLADFAIALRQHCTSQKPRCWGLVPPELYIRGIYEKNGLTVFLIEEQPGLRTLRWLCADSPKDFGEGATYRDVSIALPYVYFFVTVDANGRLGGYNSVYFRNERLRSLSDPLCEPHLYNCSVDPRNMPGLHCWICTQFVDQREVKDEQSPFDLVNNFIMYFWSSGFNASSEHHEGNSFWGKNREAIANKWVRSIEAWERASKDNPSFAVTVPWVSAQRTARDIYREVTSCVEDISLASVSDFVAVLKQCSLP